MENIIRKGIGVLLIYSILILFTIYMSNRVERLNAFQNKHNYAGIMR